MIDLKTQLRLLGKMCFERDQELLEKVESLEHLSNQHDILLIGLLKVIDRNYGQSTSIGITKEKLDDTPAKS